MDYIAKCKCGGLIFWCAESCVKNCTKEISGLLKKGYSIERADIETIRATPFCKNHGKCNGAKYV